MAYKRYRGNSGQYERISDPVVETTQSAAVPFSQAQRPTDSPALDPPNPPHHALDPPDPPLHALDPPDPPLHVLDPTDPPLHNKTRDPEVSGKPDAVTGSAGEPHTQKTGNRLLNGGFGDIFGSLGDKLNPANMETEDILILMILYLLYRESGDTELLIIMAAMLLL